VKDSPRHHGKPKPIKVADIIDNTKSITAHDPDFARVYLKEISALLDVLVDADPNLLALAHDQLRPASPTYILIRRQFSDIACGTNHCLPHSVAVFLRTRCVHYAPYQV
jgi:hypothetical protein